jgi:hypothetical protein
VAEENAADLTTVPRTIEDLGIPIALVQDLVVRLAFVEGRTSTVRLSERLAINPTVMTPVVEGLRDLKVLEVTGLEGRDYQLTLTEEGRRQATERMQMCRYTGAAPVSLDSYRAVIRVQHAELDLDIGVLREAFGDLTVRDGLLAEIGPAVMGRGAMFIYGPPGTGKTSIAERLRKVHQDYVLLPYAVEVDSQIITVFDPVIHIPAPEQPSDVDPRWILCERPFITVGGELTGDVLDLAFQSSSGIYLAPLQMQANNGILVIDDFGRQTLRPEELLNRWIVPLDRRVDYLSLDYGVKFEVPFDPKIVFSTNLEPEELGDEAFYRRIQSKVLVPPIDDEQFDEVLRRAAESAGVQVTPDAPEHLRWVSRELGDGDLRPYLPHAVCQILEAICAFEGRPLVLDPNMVERIGHMYFTRDTHPDPGSSSILGMRASVGFDDAAAGGSPGTPPVPSPPEAAASAPAAAPAAAPATPAPGAGTAGRSPAEPASSGQRF